MMVQEYKRNHTIPRCMLNYWVDESGIYPGVHVYNIAKKRIYKSEARGKRAFSFAIANDLHIVDVDGERATSLERWLSSLESTLGYFIQLISKQESIDFDRKDEFKLAMAFLALETRSKYNLENMRQYLEKHQEYVAVDIKKISLENLIDYVTFMARDYLPLELIILYSGEKSWLLCDRPFFNWEGLSHRFVVLTNKIVLGYRKSPDNFRYLYENSPSVDEVNRMIALQARDWIASEKTEIIQKYIPVFSERAYIESKQNDEITEIKLEEPKRGWEIFN
jgi:hypothetical protein